MCLRFYKYTNTTQRRGKNARFEIVTLLQVNMTSCVHIIIPNIELNLLKLESDFRHVWYNRGR